MVALITGRDHRIIFIAACTFFAHAAKGGLVVFAESVVK